MADNLLYYGDNLDILQRYNKDESVDLVYLDPPFKSNQDYNVLFAENDGSRSAAPHSPVMSLGQRVRAQRGTVPMTDGRSCIIGNKAPKEENSTVDVCQQGKPASNKSRQS